MALRRWVALLGIAGAVAGCPAFVYDPPYAVDEEDASANADATAIEAGALDAGRDSPADDAGAIPALDAGSREADAAGDAAPDASRRGDGGCPGVLCNGVCDPDATDCSACTGQTSLCFATGVCQSDCAGCGTVSCLLCPGGGPASGAVRGCGAECLSGQYPHCSCTDATSCGVANQTCMSGQCATCGEMSTGGQRCYGKCTPPIKTETCVEGSSACSCM